MTSSCILLTCLGVIKMDYERETDCKCDRLPYCIHMSLSIITSDGSEEVLEPANEMYICCKEIFNEVKEQYEELPLCLRILPDLLEKMKQIRDQVKDSSKDQVKDSLKNNTCLIELYDYIKSLDYLVYLYNQGQNPIEGIRAKYYIESSCNDETTIKKILRE